jgi:catechol 2,3-dioxygenase-like lactoylglutathione lyase family enzyme
MPETAHTPPQLVQIAMCSTNVVRTVQFFSEALGFVESGREGLWGRMIAQTQGLGDDMACIIWWMTGAQSFMQLEIFQHFDPIPAPLPSDWQPSDLGWVRWGCAVPDFDGVLTRLAALNVHPIAPPRHFGGRRRMAVRIPHVGTVLEIIEDGPGAEASQLPRVVYATLSVPDLETARRFWTKSMLVSQAREGVLHTRDMETLWGLDDAELSRCVLPMHECWLELVQYRSPAPRARANYRLCDQGMQNIGIGYRRFEPLRAMADRMAKGGVEVELPRKMGDGDLSGNYASTPDGFSFEAMAVPPAWDQTLGFESASTWLKVKLAHRNPSS